jgi:hypothetical protein
LLQRSQHLPRMWPIWQEVQNPAYFMTGFDGRCRHWKSGKRIGDLALFWRPWPTDCVSALYAVLHHLLCTKSLWSLPLAFIAIQ